MVDDETVINYTIVIIIFIIIFKWTKAKLTRNLSRNRVLQNKESPPVRPSLIPHKSDPNDYYHYYGNKTVKKRSP